MNFKTKDIVKINLNKIKDKTPSYIKLIKKEIKSGNGLVEILKIEGNYAEIGSVNNSMSKFLGGPQVPLSSLEKNMKKESMYPFGKGRKYRLNKQEISGAQLYTCPRCKTDLKTKPYKMKSKLYICPKCLFMTKDKHILKSKDEVLGYLDNIEEKIDIMEDIVENKDEQIINKVVDNNVSSENIKSNFEKVGPQRK